MDNILRNPAQQSLTAIAIIDYSDDLEYFSYRGIWHCQITKNLLTAYSGGEYEQEEGTPFLGITRGELTKLNYAELLAEVKEELSNNAKLLPEILTFLNDLRSFLEA